MKVLLVQWPLVLPKLLPEVPVFLSLLHPCLM